MSKVRVMIAAFDTLPFPLNIPYNSRAYVKMVVFLKVMNTDTTFVVNTIRPLATILSMLHVVKNFLLKFRIYRYLNDGSNNASKVHFGHCQILSFFCFI